MKKKKVKQKFKIQPNDIDYISKRVNSLYKELKKEKLISGKENNVEFGKSVNENKQLFEAEYIEGFSEDGMTIIIELKYMNKETVNFEIGNDFNNFQKKILSEIIECFKKKIPTEIEYLDELIEYL